jgi:hypothetical protein
MGMVKSHWFAEKAGFSLSAFNGGISIAPFFETRKKR